MAQEVTGHCLCGAVHYRVADNLGIFQYCHCSRCRRFTGSAHAANLFVLRDNFFWVAGEENMREYSPPDTKYFRTAFCAVCGSSLPWLSKNGKVMVVPAGTLDAHPGVEPSQNIFCGSRAGWYKAAADLPEYDALPPKI
ncbi:GFA family protein [Teredinibacter turnerae]|uniref:GFA family protein n=1 Tax=Teredinibacter turnerae TaxID=2426 RepID=UPI000375AEB7|nr:GFA family protein [Teredinibacter turnerae]